MFYALKLSLKIQKIKERGFLLTKSLQKSVICCICDKKFNFLTYASVAELVDATDSKSVALCGRAGSIPARGTI